MNKNPSLCSSATFANPKFRSQQNKTDMQKPQWLFRLSVGNELVRSTNALNEKHLDRVDVLRSVPETDADTHLLQLFEIKAMPSLPSRFIRSNLRLADRFKQPIKATGRNPTSSASPHVTFDLSHRNPSQLDDSLPRHVEANPNKDEHHAESLERGRSIPSPHRSPSPRVLDPTEQNQPTNSIVPPDHPGSAGFRCRRRADPYPSCTETDLEAVSRSHPNEGRFRCSDTDGSHSDNHVHHSPAQRILPLRHHAFIKRQHRSFHTSVGLDNQYTVACVHRSFRYHSHVSHSTADAQRQSAVLRVLAGQ